MADTHVTSGFITIGSGLSLVGSGMNVITSVSGNTVSLTPGTTVQLAPAGVFVMSGQVNTSVSGNVVNISGQQVQTSISGNIIQTSISGNAISISGDILLTSFSGNVFQTSISGNVITLVPQTSTPATTQVIQQTAFVLSENQSGGVALPDIGTFLSGAGLAFIPASASQYSGIQLPQVYWGYSNQPPFMTPGLFADGLATQSPAGKYIGTIGVIGYPFRFIGLNPIAIISPTITNTSGIRVMTSGGSGLILWYGGWQ